MPAEPLISVAELAAALGGGHPPRLLDVRWPVPGPADRAGYLAAHLPGALFVDLDVELATPPGGAAGGRHPLPEEHDFTAAMRNLGVGAGAVVVYDGAAGFAAGRAWWCLRYFGHRDVRLLDGGLAAWQAAGLPVQEGDPPVVAPGDFTALRGHLPVLDAAQAAALARDGALLDVRSAARYEGEEPIDPIGGHIPGALSAPTTGNVDADGGWLPAAALRARFAGLGATDVPVGAYCGSGVTSAHTVLAAEVAGLDTPALYVGSWSEWCANAARPIADGPSPG